MASTARSSPIVPETKTNGTSGSFARARSSAASPPKPGMLKSDRISCGLYSSSARRRLSSLCTRWKSRTSPARCSSRIASSASAGESSTTRILSCSTLSPALLCRTAFRRASIQYGEGLVHLVQEVIDQERARQRDHPDDALGHVPPLHDGVVFDTPYRQLLVVAPQALDRCRLACCHCRPPFPRVFDG